MKLNFILADNGTENTYIMMEARLDALFKKPEEYTVIERFAVIGYNYSRISCSISCIMLQQKDDNLLLGGFWYYFTAENRRTDVLNHSILIENLLLERCIAQTPWIYQDQAQA